MKNFFKSDNVYFFKNPLLIKIVSLTDFFGNLLYRKKDKKISFERILISNIGHLGDFLISSTIVDVLRKSFPKSKIYFLGNKEIKPIIDLNKKIDESIAYSYFFGNRNINLLKELYFIFKTVIKVRKLKIDFAIDLRADFPNTITLLKLAGVKFLVGFPTVGFGFLLDKKIQFQKDLHETENFLNTINWIKNINENLTKYEKNRIDLSFIDNPSREIKNLINKLMRNYIVCSPFSRNHQKMIPWNEWIKIINQYKNKFHILFIGKTNDKYPENLIIGDNVINLINKTNITDLIHILKNSNLVITVDSFVGQICSLLNIPSIIIFKGFVNNKRFGPIGSNCKMVISNKDCIDCYETGKYKKCNFEKCYNINLIEEIQKIYNKQNI